MHSFEITIRKGGPDAWPVVTETYDTGSGFSSRHEGTLTLDEDVRASLDAATLDTIQYGTVLGKALLQDDVRDAFATALARARSADDTLRVLIVLEDRELEKRRWERLCAPFDGEWDHLALRHETPFSFYIPTATDRRFPPIGRRDMRALVVVASPTGLDAGLMPPFDVEATVSTVVDALGHILDPRNPPDVLATGGGGPPTFDAMLARLTAGHYTLLHIVAHGAVRDGDTYLFLARDDNQVDAVSSRQLIDGLAKVRRPPYLTFLSSCETSSAAAPEAIGGMAQLLVRELGMPAVVAMTERVSLATAGALSAAFYGRLSEFGEPDRALTEATAALLDRPDILVPALYGRLAGRALFDEDMDRELTGAEAADGLARLKQELQVRAPAVVPRLEVPASVLSATQATDVGSLTPELRRSRAEALDTVGVMCLESVGLSFVALALGKVPPVYDERCPFPGLAAFTPDDRSYYFGRERLVTELADRLSTQPFLPVLGPSGSGKSSLVYAGLLPELERRDPNLRWADCRPGSSPVAALDGALAELPDSGGMLIVDQFEESFTLCRDEHERVVFFDRILAEVPRRRVVVTMRADFWGDCASHEPLRAAMQASQELIGPLTPTELRSVMEQQASQVGLRFEADLAATIMEDVTGEPGAMPLLQHALLELWKRRHGTWLKTTEYRELGRVSGAIARTAESEFESLSEADQTRARDIFLRLTRVDPDVSGDAEARDTRRRVAIADLVSPDDDPADVRAIVASLASKGLVVTRDAVPLVAAIDDQASPVSGDVEVAHEALIRHWPRLRQWLTTDRVGLRLRDELGEAARAWDGSGRKDDFLQHRGTRLADAEALLRQTGITLNTSEQAYVDACAALRTREQEEAEQRREEDLRQAQELAATAEARRAAEQLAREEADRRAASESRARKRYAVLAGAAAVLALVTAGAFVFATVRQREAEEAKQVAIVRRHEAEDAQQAATVRALLLQVPRQLDERQDDRAALLARLAFDLDTNQLFTAQVDDALRTAIETARFSSRLPGQGFQTGNAVALSPDGTRIAAAEHNGQVRLWQLTHPTADPILLGNSEPFALAFDATGTRLVAATAEGTPTVETWDIANPSAGPTVATVEDLIMPVSIESDGAMLTGWSNTGRLCLWNMADPSEPVRSFVLPGTVQWSTAVAFAPDLETGVVVDASGGVWRFGAGGDMPTLLTTLDENGDPASARQSGDGTLLYVAFAGGPLVALELASPTEAPTVVIGSEGRVHSIALSRDGTRMASTGTDSAVRVWELSPGLDYARHLGPYGDEDLTGQVSTAGLASSGPMLVLGRFDGTVEGWNRAEPAERLWVTGPEVPEADVTQLVLSADGSTVAGTWGASRLMYRPTSDPTATFMHVLTARLPISSLAMSDDGRWLVVGSESGTVDYIDLAPEVPTTAPQWSFPDGEEAYVNAVAVDSTGQVRAAATADGRVAVWGWQADPQQDPLLLEPPASTSPEYTALAFSPTDRLLAAGTADGRVVIWTRGQPSAAQQLTRPDIARADELVEALAFDAGETVLASVGEGGLVLIWETSRLGETPRALFGRNGALVDPGRDIHVVSASFNQDLDQLEVGYSDGSVIGWLWRTQAVADLVCGRVWRDLTTDEWQRYVDFGEPRKVC